MSHVQTQSHSPSLLGALSVPFKAVWNVLIDLANASSYSKELDRLNALNDAELAEKGLTRDGIIAHVFRGAMIS